MIREHKTALEREEEAADAGRDVPTEDILTTLLRLQSNGGVTLTNESVSGILFVSQPHLANILSRTPQIDQYFYIIFVMSPGHFLDGVRGGDDDNMGHVGAYEEPADNGYCAV
jgi:hypothetical protein